MKKFLHLLPLMLLTVIALLGLLFVFFESEFSLTFAFVLMVLLDCLYIASVYFVPFDEKGDILWELPMILLLFCFIPGSTSLFLHMIPYSSPILLLPLFSFILCLIVFCIKIKHYNLIKKHQDK